MKVLIRISNWIRILTRLGLGCKVLILNPDLESRIRNPRSWFRHQNLGYEFVSENGTNFQHILFFFNRNVDIILCVGEGDDQYCELNEYISLILWKSWPDLVSKVRFTLRFECFEFFCWSCFLRVEWIIDKNMHTIYS